MAAWKWMPFKRERVNKWETEEDKPLIPQMLAEWIYFFCKSFLFFYAMTIYLHRELYSALQQI